MSVINRMLTDLERRGAPGARRQRTADGPASAEPPRRVLRWLRRLGPPTLLVALLLVAAALWREQWPRVWMLVESTRAPQAAEAAGNADDPANEPGANGTADSGDTGASTSSDATQVAVQTDATEEVDRTDRAEQAETSTNRENSETEQTEQAEQAGIEEDDRDPLAADGQDSATRNSASPDGDGAEGGGGARTAAANDHGEAGQAEARSDEPEGQVRKSEPDIAPQERARRLEAKARDALDDGDIAAAREHLKRALAFDADRHSARDLLVGLSLRSGDSAAARNLLAEGVARAPERAAYAKPFARLLVDAGDLERALRVLRRAVPAAERDAGYHGLTAAVAQRLKRHDLAASEYTRALEIDSSRGVWWMGLGISLRATDHPEEALAAFREARASGDLNERLDRWVQQRIEALSRTGE